ncbi:MAG TPA: (Fe-S)-binding protein, partial [Propionibacteriaceae bacterium]|nr:(Fe-S)-binding protein [Propionibacteriaceae bacterium]
MGAAQIIATVLAAAVTVVAVVLAVRAVVRITAVIRLGRPDPARFSGKGARTRTMLTETLGHTRMLKWSTIGAAHWFVMVSFIILFLLVLEAYFEVVDPTGGLPIVGHWAVYGLVTEWIGVLGLAGILYLIYRRQSDKNAKRSRFTGSTMWQGYFVEAVIVGVLICGFLIRGFKVANGTFEFPGWATPVSHGVGALLPAAADGPTWVALVKLFISMGWLITIALNVTMGVAWHRFLAFPNIFFKRDPGKPAGSGLGPLKPMMSDGKPLDFEEADPEKDQFGVAQVEQFTWKGLLDFSTCTECGRCQSQCPAWNTAKPLSPKLLVLSLRDNAYAKAPYLLAGGGKDLTGEEKATTEQLAGVDVLALAEAERPLIGTAEEQGVIDPDVLWSCTTCGACVEQCPVDIEHVDHIVDMRRYQVLIESSFPSEAGVMLRNLENKGNPWGAPPNTREDWTKGLDFEVPRVGEKDFEYLFWVGCAGAFEDRAKKTTRAVATLLHEAGVNYAILGEGETCTG